MWLQGLGAGCGSRDWVLGMAPGAGCWVWLQGLAAECSSRGWVLGAKYSSRVWVLGVGCGSRGWGFVAREAQSGPSSTCLMASAPPAPSNVRRQCHCGLCLPDSPEQGDGQLGP